MTLVDEKTTLERQTDDGQEVYTLKSGGSAIGYVVVDSKFANTSCGGLRIAWDVSATEIAAAARAMTLKYGFLGLPQGEPKPGSALTPRRPWRNAGATFCGLPRPQARCSATGHTFPTPTWAQRPPTFAG